MNPSVSSAPDQHLRLACAPAPAPYEALVIAVPGFPVPESELERIRAFLRVFCASVRAKWKLTPDVFLKISQLHLGDGSTRVQDNARNWLPAIGLGVWAARPAPTAYTDEDFLELGIGQRPRNIVFQVLHVTQSPEQADHARDVMLGLGSVVQSMTADGAQAFLAKATQLYQPTMTDRTFNFFPFYLPLLDPAAIAAAQAGQLDGWLCGAEVYIHEVAEDGCVLILANRPLEPVLASINCRPEGGGKPGWLFAV
jgi:hypothetical protein